MTASITGTQNKPHPLQNYVQSQLNSGADEETLVSELGKSGVEAEAARRLIRNVQANPTITRTGDSASFQSIQAAILGGLIASVVAGSVWGAIIILTGWEFGIVAWAVGAACGYGVLLFSKGETTSTHQFIAIVSGIFGILIGKYFAFYVALKDIIAAEVGPETAARMSVFSLQLFGQYLANLGEVLGMYDMLWIALAIISAWKITGSAK